MTPKECRFECMVLEEKLKALNTLVRYESNAEKLNSYYSDLAAVAQELGNLRNNLPAASFQASA
jgi:hypothetical protein